MEFKKTLLNQIKDYLDGKITKEEYGMISEEFYSEYADACDDQLFRERYLNTVADACLFYIDEPAGVLSPEKVEELFYQSLSEAYGELQDL